MKEYGYDIPKVSPNVLARKINSEPYVVPQPDPIVETNGFIRKRKMLKQPSNESEALDIYLAGKEERYALAAVLIDRVVDRALGYGEEFGPYGLLTRATDWDVENINEDSDLEPLSYLHAPNPFRQVAIAVEDTLWYAWGEEMEDLSKLVKNDTSSPAARAFIRSKEWEQYFLKYVPHSSNGTLNFPTSTLAVPNGPFTLSPTGITTAAFIMGKTLEIIPEVCERALGAEQTTPEVCYEVAKNSYPLIATMASMQTGENMAMEMTLTGKSARNSCANVDRNLRLVDRLLPAYFNISESRIGKSLTLDHHAFLVAQNILDTNSPYYPGDKRNGCPALVPVDGPSPIMKLWDKNVEISKKAYSELWRYAFEPRETAQKRHNEFVAIVREHMPKGSLIYGIDI